jgi:3-phenylpropionate/cinnamic acid dioxygenase small subunit
MQSGIVYADTRAMLRDRVLALRDANVYEEQRYRHIIGAPFILEQAADSVTVESPYMVARTMRDGSMQLFATGRYLDRIVSDADGSLKFAERLAINDSNDIDTLLVIPL